MMLVRHLASAHVRKLALLGIKRKSVDVCPLGRYVHRFSSTSISTQTKKSSTEKMRIETPTDVSSLGAPLSSILNELEDMKANKDYIEAIDIFKKHRENMKGGEMPVPYSIKMMSIIDMSIRQERDDYSASKKNQLIVRTHKGHYKHDNVFYTDKILRKAHLAFEIYRDVLEQCSDQALALSGTHDAEITAQHWELIDQHSLVAIGILKAIANIPQPILMEHAPLVEQCMGVYNNVHDMYVQMAHRVMAKQQIALREQQQARAATEGKGLEFFMPGASPTSNDVNEALSSNKRYINVVAEILPVLIRIAGKVHRYEWVENMFANMEQIRESNQLSPGQAHQSTISMMSAAACCGEMEMVHQLWNSVLEDHQASFESSEDRKYSRDDSSKYGKLNVGLLNNYLLHCKRHGAHVHALKAYRAMQDLGRSRFNWDTYGHLLSLTEFHPRNMVATDQEDHVGDVKEIDMLDWSLNKLDRRRKSVKKQIMQRMQASLAAQEYDGLPSVPLTLLASHTGAHLVKEGHLGQIMNAERVMECDDKDASLCKVWQKMAYYLKKDGEIVSLMQLIDNIQIYKPATPAMIMLDLIGAAVSLLDTLGHREDALLFLDNHMYLIDDIVTSTRSQKRVSRVLKMDTEDVLDESEDLKDGQRWAAGKIPLQLLFSGLQSPSKVDDGENPTTEVGPTGAGKKDDMLPLVLNKVLEHCMDEYGVSVHQRAMVQLLIFSLQSATKSSEAMQCLQLYRGKMSTPASNDDTVLYRTLLNIAIEKNKHDIKQEVALQKFVNELWKE